MLPFSHSGYGKIRTEQIADQAVFAIFWMNDAGHSVIVQFKHFIGAESDADTATLAGSGVNMK